VDAVYAYLARTPCWLVGVQLGAVTGQTVQVNVPGSSDERFPNWRRRMPGDVDSMLDAPAVVARTELLNQTRHPPEHKE
jgi:4-alpha-glucanotransferase